MHAAGICPRKPILEMSDEDWREVLRVNLDGTFYVTREVARVMAKQSSGTMILITSDRGVHGSIDYAHYAASKGGMLALAKSLALTLGKYGVTVNAINPVSPIRLLRAPRTRSGRTSWRSTCSASQRAAGDRRDWCCSSPAPAGAFMTGQVVSARMRYGA